MKKQIVKPLILSVTCAGLLVLSGCSAMNTAIVHRDLKVQTKMSSTIFLNPVSPAKKIIFVQTRNTSGKDVGNLQSQIDNILTSRGYKITQDPSKAEFMLQMNVLDITKANPRQAYALLNSGFGDAVSGAALAGGVAALASNYNSSTTLGVGLAGAAIGDIAHDLVKDVNYVMITDVQVKQRTQNGETVVQTQNANMANGTSGHVTQQITGAKTTWMTYRTRVASKADKVNLTYKEAEPKLMSGLTKSVAGIF